MEEIVNFLQSFLGLSPYQNLTSYEHFQIEGLQLIFIFLVDQKSFADQCLFIASDFTFLRNMSFFYIKFSSFKLMCSSYLFFPIDSGIQFEYPYSYCLSCLCWMGFQGFSSYLVDCYIEMENFHQCLHGFTFNNH